MRNRQSAALRHQKQTIRGAYSSYSTPRETDDTHDYLYYDLLIGMDTANIRNMTRIAGGSDSLQKIFKMLSFADYGTNHKLTAARDVADPWYTGDFDATFDDVISGCRGLLEYIKEVYNL